MRRRDIYRQTIQQTAAPRDVEYRLIAQVTSALIDCKKIVSQADKDPKKMRVLVEALNANKRMWDVFLEDVGSSGNQLPPKLRADIISLCIWVGKESDLILNGRGDINALITINKMISRGLAGTRPDAPTANLPLVDLSATA